MGSDSEAVIPPPPPGFTLDGETPPLPPGFKLDQQPADVSTTARAHLAAGVDQYAGQPAGYEPKTSRGYGPGLVDQTSKFLQTPLEWMPTFEDVLEKTYGKPTPEQLAQIPARGPIEKTIIAVGGNAAKSAAEFMRTPAGLALGAAGMGGQLGELTPVVNTLVSGTFAGDMALHFPEQWDTLRKAAEHYGETGDIEPLRQAAGDLVTTGAFTYLLGRASVTHGKGVLRKLDNTFSQTAPEAPPPAGFRLNPAPDQLTEGEYISPNQPPGPPSTELPAQPGGPPAVDLMRPAEPPPAEPSMAPPILARTGPKGPPPVYPPQQPLAPVEQAASRPEPLPAPVAPTAPLAPQPPPTQLELYGSGPAPVEPAPAPASPPVAAGPRVIESFPTKEEATAGLAKYSDANGYPLTPGQDLRVMELAGTANGPHGIVDIAPQAPRPLPQVGGAAAEAQPPVFYAGDQVETRDGEKWTVGPAPEDATPGQLTLFRNQYEPGPDGTQRLVDSKETTVLAKDVTPVASMEGKPVAAVKLNDGTVVVGSRGTHVSLAQDLEAKGQLDQVAQSGWDVPGRGFVPEDQMLAESRASAAPGEPAAAGASPEAGFVRFGKGNPQEQAAALLKRLSRQNTSLLGRHNVNISEQLAPAAYARLRARAGTRGGMRMLVGTANVQGEKAVTKALGNNAGRGVADKFWRAQQESQREGARDTHAVMQKLLATTPDADFAKVFNTQVKRLFDSVVDDLNPKDPKARRKVKSSMTRAIRAKDWQGARRVAALQFQAAEQATPMMSPEMRSFIDTPEYRLFRSEPTVDNLMKFFNEIGRRAGLPVKQLVGPTGDFVPLVPQRPQTGSRGKNMARRPALSPARLASSYARTGIGDFDPSIRGMVDALRQNFGALNKNEAIQLYQDAGLIKKLPIGQPHPKTFEVIPGNPEDAYIFPYGSERVGRNGRTLPPPNYVTGKSLAAEIQRIFDPNREIDDREGAELVRNRLVRAFLVGVAEPGFHGQRQVSNLSHALGIPFPEAARRIAFASFDSPEALDSTDFLAKHGRIPDRVASVAASREMGRLFASEVEGPALWKTGPHWYSHFGLKAAHTANFSPFIFGPHGIDQRVRLVADMWFKEMAKDHPKTWGAGDLEAARGKFQENFGTYVNEMKTKWQKIVGSSAIQPFITARLTAIRNALETMGLSDNLTPLKGVNLAAWRMRQLFTSHIIGGLVAFYLLSKAISSLWPHEDEGSSVMEVDVPRFAQDWPWLKAFYSSRTQTRKRIGIGWMFADAMTALRLTGLHRGYNTLMRGGDSRQVAEAMAAEAASTVLGVFTGPILSTAMAGAGVIPYITSLNDQRTGQTGGVHMMSSLPRETKGPGIHFMDRVYAMIKEIAPIVGEASSYYSKTAEERSQADDQQQPRLPKQLVSILLKNLIASEEDVSKTQLRLQQEQRRFPKN